MAVALRQEATMAGRVQGKLALVTAAGQGIGRAIAETLAAEGAKLIATDIDDSKLAGLTAAKAFRLDARSTKAVEDAARALSVEFGALDILVNCAGFVHHGSVLECSEDDWDFSFDLNVKSMHRTIKAFLPGMLEKKRGAIVNISSVASSVTGLPNRYVYGASKAAVIGLTKSVAIDFIRQGIRCNAICPGTIESPSLEQRIDNLAKSTGKGLEAARQSFVDRQPMGRLGTAQEVAALALFLASDEASYITGQPYLVDGGLAL
jgi:2-dehydro-3-deoxy-L-fuconate 4-dehydrogenase